MGLFQKSVLKKYLAAQDDSVIEKSYKKYRKFFHNKEIQENIKSIKEEQFQAKFLIQLFVDILGYTLNPDPSYNLTTEFKNEKGAKKADGALLKDGKALAVIELKGTKTKDLERIRQQAFDYKAHQSACVYVITSNFEKVRFYINNAIDYEDFNLFTLRKDEFALLYLCLHKDNLLNNVPLQIKNDSLVSEEKITKKLYADYSLFKRELFRDLVKLNMKNEVFRAELEKEDKDRAVKNIKLTIFRKSQKLIDRFLFIFFAEDRGLLPPNSTLKILEQWDTLKDLDTDIPLYNRYKKYFSYLDIGRKRTATGAEIFAYNGGLFKPDPILDSMVISDELLYKYTKKLSNYDFESQVDVNILGHIFENSLNEIESVNAEIEGIEFDKQKTKRKKDGVFYTPKYITKYMVDNTIGKLCLDKKEELGFVEEEYLKSAKGRRKATLEALKDILKTYREWLLSLTILDPACGSGAFLNQAIDFLIKEHQSIDELQASLFGQSLVFQDIENTILENNIYGVDLNDESVEIAKLSLWLRTAQPRRKLNSLNNNIKCGNSLVDSKTVAGNKAFNWEEEFPDVFANGGFDVVIGNPPYLRVQGLRENFRVESEFYEKKYQSATGRFDVYVLFMEKAFELINPDGTVSFILPHKFMISDFGVGIRNFLVENKFVESIVHFGAEMVFSDASTYTCIINLSHKNPNIWFKQVEPKQISNTFKFDEIDYGSISQEKWNLKGKNETNLFKKLHAHPLIVKDVFENISQGVVSVGDDIFLMKGRVEGKNFIGYSERNKDTITLEADLMKPLLKGENVKKYAPLQNSYYCLYPHYQEGNKTLPFDEDYFKENYPLAYSYMLPFKEELIEKKVRYKTNPKAWYSLHRSRDINLFEQKKIVTPETSLGGNMTLDELGYYHNTQVYTLEKKVDVIFDEKFLLSILNSALFWYYLQSTGAVLRGGYFRFKTKYLEPFPLPKVENIEIQKPFIKRVDTNLLKTAEYTKISKNFIQYFASQFNLDVLSKKLQSWHNLDFKDFIKELNKAIKKAGGEKLSKMDEMDWMEVFETKRAEAQALKAEIEQVDKEIDQMVYELYDLTPEEIEIVENS